jgi:hypothetical protein
MLPNEVFALACRAYYEEQGLIVDKRNGEFAHCPYPEGMGETGYYLLWEHHQQQGLLQSKDVGKCCFFVGHAHKWLSTCDYWPDNYFELWDFFQEFSRHHTEELWRSRSPKEKEKIKLASHSQQANASRRVSMKKVHSRKTKEEKKRIMANAVKTICKPLEVTFADGRVGVYPSYSFASRALRFGKNALRRMMQNNRCIVRGPYKGMNARYV